MPKGDNAGSIPGDGALALADPAPGSASGQGPALGESRGDPRKASAIREAAFALFRDHGYGSVSMDQVAREAAVSKATLYAHFGSKEALFADIVRLACEGPLLSPEFAEAYEHAGVEPRTILTLFGRHFVSLLTRRQTLGFFRMVIAESHRFPELGRIFYESGPIRMKARLTDLMTRLDASGRLAIPDPARAAEQFVGMLKGEHHLHALLGLADLDAPSYAAAMEETVQAAVGTFLRAFGRAS